MVNPIKRFKEWRDYKIHMHRMKACIERQKEAMRNNTLDESTKNKLFKRYVRIFIYHANAVLAYQEKYFCKKS